MNQRGDPLRTTGTTGTTGYTNNQQLGYSFAQQSPQDDANTYGTSKKVVIQYGTADIDELEKQTQRAREELRASHSNLYRAREDVNREKKANEDLRQKGSSPSPIRTPTKTVEKTQKYYEIQTENNKLLNQKQVLEKEMQLSASKQEMQAVREDEIDSALLIKE